jgi:hypothetical protein
VKLPSSFNSNVGVPISLSLSQSEEIKMSFTLAFTTAVGSAEHLHDSVKSEPRLRNLVTVDNTK